MNRLKRLLAVLLTACVIVGDCGSMTVFATENAIANESSVSENNPVFSEVTGSEPEANEDHTTSPETIPQPDATVTTETDKTDTERNLPALHIGQIPDGEKLPSADDDFIYDLALSIRTDEKLILFTNYDIDEIPDIRETGSLEWSILRGEKELTPGSANLLHEEDDWIGFETVTASPLFSLEEITDEESEYHQMLMLASGAAADDETCDYYIRAAYYTETETGKSETFYAAATLPLIAQKATDETPDGENADAAETEQSPVSDSETVSENDVPNESLSENTTGTETVDETPLDEGTITDTPEETAKQESFTEEDTPKETSGDSISENSTTLQTADSQADQPKPDAQDQPQDPPQLKDGVGVLTLNVENITLHPTPAKDAKFSVTATLEPKDIEAPVITWSSSDPEIATVTAPVTSVSDNDAPQGTAVTGKTVEITALKEGTAVITAVYGDSKASVLVTILPEDKDNKEVYDLSGELWVNGFEQESDDLVYTGQKITQDFKVYHNETLLKEKTDYTLSYKNNVNAATWDSTKAPSVTITMKGQYSGSRTLYFTIKPKDISTIDANPANADDPTRKDSPGYEQVVNYAKKLNIPVPVLTFNKKKLAANRDFTCDYTAPEAPYERMPANPKDGNAYIIGYQYSYTVRGKGNYTGSLFMRLIVLNKDQNFNTASVTLNAKKYAYHGTPLTKDDVKIDQLKIGKTILEPSQYDYDVVNTNGLSGAYINVYPTASGKAQGYQGSKQVNLKLEADRPINKAALIEANWQTAIPFSQKTLNEKGGMYQENDTLLTFTDETGKTDTLVKDIDYTLKYSNVKKVGKVTVTFVGKGRYKGSLKKTYQITANTEKDHFTYHWKNVKKGADGKLTISYQKGGAIPDFVLRDQDQNILKPKTDYKVTYKNNQIPKGETSSEMTCEITGVGNYKGYQESIRLTVTPADIGNATLTVADKPHSTSKNAWKSTVTITDINGKKLAAGTDYDKEIIYSHTQELSPAVGTTITVTVKGINSYAGSTISGSYRIFDKQYHISKLQIVIDPQEYTGREITLQPKDIHIYANSADKRNKVELPDKESCYEIIGYKNNIKSGNAKVTLHGLGIYGGTKICTFKIQKKVYLKNSVDKITLSKTDLSFSLLDQKAESRTITATITPKDPTHTITNPTVIWSSSNSSIAAVESTTAVNDKETNATIITAVITAKKQGTVTITATAQDGNKKAQCRVTVTLPALIQKGQTLEGEVGDTRQLTFNPQPESMEGITFKSSNEHVASVDGNGLITMKKPGLAAITVSIMNIEQKCYVVIGGEPDLTDDRVLTYHQAAGCTDDTKPINDLLQMWEDQVKYQHINNYDYLYIPAGEYHINPAANPGFTAGIILRDGQSLIMAPEAKLIAKPTSSENYRIIYAFNRENIYISGGKLIGNNGGGESGHGIEIVGCTNVHIRDVEVSNCHGDGIYLGLSNGKYSTGVTLTGCNLHHNKRSNLSITEASNVTINNCDFNYAGGLAPHCGIDIEPNHGQTCSNIKISNSRFKGNRGETIQILGQVNAHVKGVTIENCKGDKAPLQWSGFGGSVSGVTESGNNWNWNGN